MIGLKYPFRLPLSRTEMVQLPVKKTVRFGHLENIWKCQHVLTPQNQLEIFSSPVKNKTKKGWKYPQVTQTAVSCLAALLVTTISSISWCEMCLICI